MPGSPGVSPGDLAPKFDASSYEEEEETSSLLSSSQLQYIDKVFVVALRQILRVPVVEVPQLELMTDPRQCLFRGGAAVAVFAAEGKSAQTPQCTSWFFKRPLLFNDGKWPHPPSNLAVAYSWLFLQVTIHLTLCSL